MTHVAATHTHDPDPPPHFNEWTQERIDLLIQLRDANTKRGTIAATINKQTGSRFSTNAVCGKIDRLFPHVIKHRLTEEELAASAERDRQRNIIRHRERRRKQREALGLPEDIRWIRRPHKVQPFAVVAFDPADFTDANVKGVANLEKHHCRWVIGDDVVEATFCGLPKMDGSSYCSHHHQIVWVSPQQRRRA